MIDLRNFKFDGSDEQQILRLLQREFMTGIETGEVPPLKPDEDIRQRIMTRFFECKRRKWMGFDTA